MIDWMASAPFDSAPPVPPRFQFNLKCVLAVTTLCAVAAAVAPLDDWRLQQVAWSILVIGSLVINLAFWGWPRVPASELVIVFCFALVMAGVAYFVIAAAVFVGLAVSFQFYLDVTSIDVLLVWAGAAGEIGALFNGNLVLNRLRRCARDVPDWSHRPESATVPTQPEGAAEQARQDV